MSDIFELGQAELALLINFHSKRTDALGVLMPDSSKRIAELVAEELKARARGASDEPIINFEEYLENKAKKLAVELIPLILCMRTLSHLF